MQDGITQLGNYRLIRQLGSGGFAEVYLGEHIHLKTQAAIKVLQAQLSGSEREDFIKEAQIVASLVHPHIVRVLEFGIEKNVPFLVMDYAPAGSQRQAQGAGQPLPLPMIVSNVKQVASALQYAHNRRIIHRDVKPENMLFRQRGELLLSDFGIAMVAQSSRYASQSPAAAGTISYMAPEQLQGQASIASDQYSLGIVIYEWLCGERPFRGSYTEVGSQHIFAPPPSLRAKLPTISPEVENVVFTALAKQPQQRFASVQLFAETFERACRIHGVYSGSNTYSSTFPISAKIPSAPPSSLAPTVPPSGTLPINTGKQNRAQPAPFQPIETRQPGYTQSTSSRPVNPTQSPYTQPAPPLSTFSSYPPPPPPPTSYPTAYPPMTPYAPTQMATPPPKRKSNSGCCIAVAVVLAFIVLGSLGSGGYAALTTLLKSGGTTPDSVNTPNTQDDSAQAGTVLYTEQGADGWSGWSLGGEWKTLHTSLLSDGTSTQTSYNGIDTLWSPHQVGTANYAVQATIQITSQAQYCYFALVGRGKQNITTSESSNYTGYAAGMSSGYSATDFNAAIAHFPLNSSSSIIDQQTYDPGGSAHTYRVEFVDNHITFKIDNAVKVRITDNVSLDGGLAGLESGNCQLAISSFSITKL